MNKIKNFLKTEARTKCPGLSEPVYQFAEYVSSLLGEKTDKPEQVTGIVMCAYLDVDQSDCGVPEYLREHHLETMLQAKFILKIFDAFDDEFSNNVRAVLCPVMGWEVPKNHCGESEISLDGQYPEWIVAAVRWWGKALENPKMDNGDNAMALFMSLLGSALTSRNTSERIQPFCNALAQLMVEEDSDTIYLEVDYHPGGLLYDALEKADVDGLQFPIKTYMIASNESVTVSCGYNAPFETVWKKNE